MGNMYGTVAPSETLDMWVIKVSLSPTISYEVKKGCPYVIKTTGLIGNVVNYEVDAVTGQMLLIKDEIKIETGYDGNLRQLVHVLNSMNCEIGKYTHVPEVTKMHTITL